MKYQSCVCGNQLMTELVVTKTFGVLVEEDGFANPSEVTEYPEPSYLCESKGCGKEYILDSKGTLVLKEYAEA